MHIYVIDPEHASGKTIRCGHCWDCDATHIELSHTGEHDPNEHLVLCYHCAYLAGLKLCPRCNIDSTVTVVAHHLVVELIPIHAPWELEVHPQPQVMSAG